MKRQFCYEAGSSEYFAYAGTCTWSDSTVSGTLERECRSCVSRAGPQTREALPTEAAPVRDVWAGTAPKGIAEVRRVSIPSEQVSWCCDRQAKGFAEARHVSAASDMLYA